MRPTHSEIRESEETRPQMFLGDCSQYKAQSVLNSYHKNSKASLIKGTKEKRLAKFNPPILWIEKLRPET